MFIKSVEANEAPAKQKKEKKTLTDKQLEGLAKGRAKVAEKRALKKAINDKKKALEKLDSKAEQENGKVDKEEKKKRKKAVKFSEEQELDWKQRKEKGEKSTSKFNKLKIGALEKIKSTKEMEEFEKIMNGVSADISKDPAKLYAYLREHADRLAPEKSRLAWEKNNKKSIIREANKKKKVEHLAEQPEEIKPNLSINIEEE